MGDDEGEYVESFVQGDDAALMAAVQQRDAAVAPLLKPGSSNPLQALQLALADPPYQTRTDSVKVCAPPSAAIKSPCIPDGSSAAFFSHCRLFALTHRARAPRFLVAQNASFDVVCKALVAIKEAEIAGAVGALSLEQCDVLMKYIYRGLGPGGKKNETYSMLLKWHPVVLQRAGPSSIIRAISEVNMAL